MLELEQCRVSLNPPFPRLVHNTVRLQRAYVEKMNLLGSKIPQGNTKGPFKMVPLRKKIWSQEDLRKIRPVVN